MRLGIFWTLLLCVGLFSSSLSRVYADSERMYLSAGWISSKTDFIPDRDLTHLFQQSLRREGVADSTDYSGIVINQNDASSGFKFLWGISVDDDFDWELGYIDLGDFSATYTANVIPDWDSATTHAEAWARGFTVHVQFSPNITENLEFMIRGGLFKWDARTDSWFTTLNPDESQGKVIENEAGYDESYGVGLVYNIAGKYGVRIDLDRYVMSEAETDVLALVGQFYF